MVESKCIRCQCTDFDPCPLGCGWVVVDRRRHIGICSECTGGQSLSMLRKVLKGHITSHRQRAKRVREKRQRRKSI